MSIGYDTDIALDADWQPIAHAGGDVLTVSGFEALSQALRLEALTTEGELFYDPDFGWSLTDYLHAQREELTLLEIKQRVRSKLSAHEKLEVLDVEVSAETDDLLKIIARWRFLGEERRRQRDLSVGRVEIEVIAID